MKNIIKPGKSKSKKILKFLFLAGLFISVFVFWPAAEVPFEIPKVWFVKTWIAVLVFCGFLLATFALKKEKVDIVLVLLVTAFLSVSFTSSIFGADLGKSIAGNFYRGDGLLKLVHMVAMFFFLALFSDINFIRGFLTVSAVTGLILSVLNIVFWLLYYFFGGVAFLNVWDGAFGLTFGNPNFLAGYLIITLPAVLYLSNIYKNELIGKYSVVFLVLQIIAILITRARIGVLGIVVFLGGVLFFRKKGKILLIPVIFAALILLVLLIKQIDITNQHNASGEFIAESRQRIFSKAILAVRQRPILGWGWANFDYAFESSDWPFKIHDDVYVDKAHSSMLEVLVTTGVVGLLIYLAIIAKTLVNLYKYKNPIGKYLLFMFIINIFHMQTNIVSISEELVFWTIAAFSLKKF